MTSIRIKRANNNNASCPSLFSDEAITDGDQPHGLYYVA